MATRYKSEVLSALRRDSNEKRALVAFLLSLDGSNLPALVSNSRPLALP